MLQTDFDQRLTGYGTDREECVRAVRAAAVSHPPSIVTVTRVSLPSRDLEAELLQRFDGLPWRIRDHYRVTAVVGAMRQFRYALSFSPCSPRILLKRACRSDLWTVGR
jgi:hypothetical protein